MKVNLGCGPHWGTVLDTTWEHADLIDYGQPFVMDLSRPETWPADLDGIELAVIHHTLHMLTPDDARACLAAIRGRSVPGAVLRIGERSIWNGLRAHAAGGEWLHDVVADDVEPTLDGKLLRWLTWHGTVRSLWSHDSLEDALHRTGWANTSWAVHGTSFHVRGADLDTRPWETFYVEARA